MDIIRQNTGRLLIFVCFVVLLFLAHHAVAAPNEAKFAEFCQAKAGEAFAALLGLITGGALAGVNGKTPSPNGPSPNVPGPAADH